MKAFRRIWDEAIKANQRFCLGESAAFDDLLRDHPDDGMVLYERGEGWEYLSDLRRSRDDFRAASGLLKNDHWRQVAKIAADRVERKAAGQMAESNSPRWSSFHLVHQVPQAPHAFRRRAIFATYRSDLEKDMAASELRACIEILANELIGSAVGANDDLATRIKKLENFKVVPDPVVTAMRVVKSTGNSGAHAEGIGDEQLKDALTRFWIVLDWARKNHWKP